MGRRSINTTKSGKYMNPTDQARKEARKKELKKNKRQRQMVRAAVLKNKDPGQILEEMEKIDEMEYNVMQPSPLNEKVLRDKRKKLKETFDRVMRLYHNDEPEHWAELKRKEVEYEKKRLKKQQYYESVKHAQSVQIDEIPLPAAVQAPPAGSLGNIIFPTANRLPPPPTALSLPPFAPGAPPGAIKKNDIKKTVDKNTETKKKEPPGIPAGPPPNLFSMQELDTDAEDDEVVLKEYNPRQKSSKVKSVPKPNSLQQRMLAISGQNIDEFMKEMENVHKKKEKEREAAVRGQKDNSDSEDENDKHSERSENSSDTNSQNSDSGSENNNDTSKKLKNEPEKVTPSVINTVSTIPVTIPLPPIPRPAAHLGIPAPPIPPVPNLAPMMFRPPPLRGIPNFGIRMPPGPPPGPRPGGVGLPPRLGIRMPPGPPPGIPHHHKNIPHHKDISKGITTITAKPQIRNLSADVTRFVPSTLRVKREENRKPNRMKTYTQEPSNSSVEANKAATKDDAYLQFMNEMQGLL
ncbi:WW domain-binding protein 11 [Teleopsis dalmanni]|uniref:WW domain-binding protein 11 n=1 Tax=Teleopsis dalmanni TaxID=139649 RepID=UPI000D32A5C2|nr:WW domain-binding protein 11 [Teleopsis dalmanni]